MVVAHAAGLLRAAGGVGLGIEVQHYTLAAEVSQLDSAAVLVGELEVGGLVSGFDHRVNTTRGAAYTPTARHARRHRSGRAGRERMVRPGERVRCARAVTR